MLLPSCTSFSDEQPQELDAITDAQYRSEQSKGRSRERLERSWHIGDPGWNMAQISMSL